MPNYKPAAGTASVHLKIVVSFLLSMMFALTVGQLAAKAFMGFDLAMGRHVPPYRTHRP